MLPGYQTKINVGVGVGIVMQLAGKFMANDPHMALFGLVLMLGGLVVFIYGTCMYAQAKGYNWALGFLGLLSCIGLVVLVVMPDKFKNPPTMQGGGFPVMPPQQRPPQQ